MQGITPASGQPAPIEPAPTRPPQGGTASVQAEAGMVSHSSSLSLSATSSSTVMMVHQGVGGMLEGFGGGLENNDLLKMIIALLILQAMNSQDTGGLEEMLGALGAAMGGQGAAAGSSMMMVQQSSSVELEMSSQTTMAYGSVAATGAYGDGPAPKPEIDATG